MKASDVYKWQKVRRKGLPRYVGKYGSLIGLALALNDLGWKAISQPLTATDIIISGSVCLFAGLLLAPLFWLVHEYQYRQWFDKDLR
jgi:hypothetical protein